MRGKRRKDVRRLDSWTGSGQIAVVPGSRERSGVLDVAIVLALCLVIDLMALIALLLLAQRNGRIVCGALCFDNPQAHIHDAEVTFWAFGIAVLGPVVFSLIVRRARIPVVILQGVVAGFVLAHTVPTLRTAEHRQDIISHCRYGLAPPCTGVSNLGPP